MKRRKSAWAYLAIAGLVVTGLVASPAPTEAQSGFQRGPNPTQATVLTNGPFATTQASNVSGGFGSGFNNVNVCYPNDTSQGTFGGFVVIPGFLSSKLQMMWACRKIASHGFVVAVMETNSSFDFPGARTDQAQGVIRHLSGSSAPAAIRQRLDTNRWAIGGWSMGGGGALNAGRENNPRLEAVVAWEPWEISSYGGMQVPAMIVGASNDFVASASGMARPFYNSILTQEKYYVELSGQGHFVGSTDNTIQSAATITWLKRWVDDDTRYTPLLCPGPGTGSGIARLENSCPM